jgi:hypothetical protein
MEHKKYHAPAAPVTSALTMHAPHTNWIVYLCGTFFHEAQCFTRPNSVQLKRDESAAKMLHFVFNLLNNALLQELEKDLLHNFLLQIASPLYFWHRYRLRHRFRDSEQESWKHLVVRWREWNVTGVGEHKRTHQDLEWFIASERNTLRQLFLYCSSKILEYRAWSLRKLECVRNCLSKAWVALGLAKLEEAYVRERTRDPKEWYGLNELRLDRVTRQETMSFYRSKARCTMHDSWVCLYHIFRQSFPCKAHEQLVLEGSRVRRGTTMCLLCYGHHVVAWRWRMCESLSTHWCAFLIKTWR